MRCEECGKDQPLTYRSPKLGKRSVCAPCIKLNHPDITIPVLGTDDESSEEG